VILRIDVQGAATLKRLAPEAVFVFVAPGSFEELHNRLQWRRTESPDQMEQRLAMATREMEAVDGFDYVVVNREDHLDDAVGQIRAIIVAEKQRVWPRRVIL
jgi:guanylate kinase